MSIRSEWKARPRGLIPATVAFFMVLLAILLGLIDYRTPPQGFRFERVAIVEGVYDCCGRSRHRSSTVDGVGIDCGTYGFIQVYGVGSCERQQQLNGKRVLVEQAKIPRLFGEALVVVRIASGGNTYFEKPDAEVREEWIANSKSNAIWLTSLLTWLVCAFGYVLLTKGKK